MPGHVLQLPPQARRARDRAGTPTVLGPSLRETRRPRPEQKAGLPVAGGPRTKLTVTVPIRPFSKWSNSAGRDGQKRPERSPKRRFQNQSAEARRLRRVSALRNGDRLIVPSVVDSLSTRISTSRTDTLG